MCSSMRRIECHGLLEELPRLNEAFIRGEQDPRLVMEVGAVRAGRQTLLERALEPLRGLRERLRSE